MVQWSNRGNTDAAMYEGDSFFTLSTAGQVGLILLSVTLAAAAFRLSSALILLWRWHETLGRYSGAVIAAVAVFWLFAWLSPQVYYTYYLFLIDGLEWKSVIGSPPGPLQFFELMTFRGIDSMAAHALGALGWVLIGHTVTATYQRGGH